MMQQIMIRDTSPLACLDVIPDGEVRVLRGEHRPPGEGLHDGRALLVQREPDLASHEGRLVGNIEHCVVNLIQASIIEGNY